MIWEGCTKIGSKKCFNEGLCEYNYCFLCVSIFKMIITLNPKTIFKDLFCCKMYVFTLDLPCLCFCLKEKHHVTVDKLFRRRIVRVQLYIPLSFKMRITLNPKTTFKDLFFCCKMSVFSLYFPCLCFCFKQKHQVIVSTKGCASAIIYPFVIQNVHYWKWWIKTNRENVDWHMSEQSDGTKKLCLIYPCFLFLLSIQFLFFKYWNLHNHYIGWSQKYIL